MLYILHFEKKVGRAQHYMGACLDGNLERRMQEHARGVGSSLTAEVVRRGVPIWVARVFPETSFEIEQDLKRRANFRMLCPLCCPLFSKLKNEAYRLKVPATLQQPARGIWDNRPLLDIREQRK